MLRKEQRKTLEEQDKRLEMNKKWYAEHIEERRAYRQIEVYCEICECKVKKNGMSQHLKTQKHFKNEEEKKKNKS